MLRIILFYLNKGIHQPLLIINYSIFNGFILEDSYSLDIFVFSTKGMFEECKSAFNTQIIRLKKKKLPV